MSERTSISPASSNAATAVANAVLPVPVIDSGIPELDKEALQRLPVQRKLSIGSPDDPLEHEADAMADKVMRMPENSFIQRKCAECEEEEKLQRKPLASSVTPFIQAKESDTASDNISQKINSTRGGGSSMDSGTKSFMESRFGADFSDVKIHTGSYSAQMSKELNAQAFTVGSDVYFNSGKYDPSSNAGKHLLAHELTHTIQQNDNVTRKLIQKNGDPPAAPVPAAPVPAAPVYGVACSGGTSDPCQYSRCGDRHDGINSDFSRAIDYAIAAYGALGADTLSERTTQALDWYFNDHSAATVSTVRERMLCIALCLMDAYGHNQYGCHPDHSAIAYVCVGSTPMCTDSVTNICLTDIYFGKSDRVRAESLIHECGHRIGLSLGGPDFDIYDFRDHFLYLSTSEALMNTDSFALFAGAITNGIRTTIILNPMFPIGLGFSGGVGLSGGSPTWYARMTYANIEIQHPSLEFFNPNLGISLTLIGESTSATDPTVSASTSFLASLTAGFRIGDPRPGSAGGGYFSFWGGPALAVGGGASGTVAGLGAEAGLAAGYRWRWLDVSAGGIYFHDPTRPEGMRDILTVGPSLSISFSPTFFSVPGSH